MTDDAQLRALEAAAMAEVALPADGHVVGEPVTTSAIRYSGLSRVGLRATCQSGESTHEVGLADVVFPPGGAGAAFVARYREWLGFDALVGPERPVEPARPHKVASDDIVVGEPVELVVLACKSNALRCRLLASTREVTLRTAVRDEIPGSIIKVTPRKQWTHARHPASRAILMRLLAQDLRCLDAHAHLGNFAFDRCPAEALRHYEMGVSIGTLSLGKTFDGVLAWGLIDNRPFLRCLIGVGLSAWRLGDLRRAAAVFRRILWLNPSDNQGARFNLAAVEAGGTWKEPEGDEA